ncbi:MAG TPA: YciI family protein [Devosiaceae bacterium]|jgi:hypothetical protein|nr:YciI family protein [Devosiaceae bacterium]
MRFLMMVKGDADYEAGRPPPPALFAGMEEYLAAQMKAGTLVGAGGLRRSAEGVQLKARDGRIAVMDGPFTEAKEIIGGYAFVEAASKADAIRMATEFIEVHFRAGVMNVDVEVREVVGGPDMA